MGRLRRVVRRLRVSKFAGVELEARVNLTQIKPKKPLIVMKFGGTSVGNPERMRNVAEIVAGHAKQAEVLVVVSAMGGVTDMLIRAANEASKGDREHWKNVRQELARRHRDVADQLLPATEQASVLPRLAEMMGNFENLCSGFSLVREITPRAMDTLSSLGEVMSATLMAAILRTQGVPAEMVDATDLIVTDEHHGNAALLFEETYVKTRQFLAPLRRRGAIPVVTGFRAATKDGYCTTLGRGGSDYTGTIMGAALEADEIWIWTDVDGVLTADPRLVPAARIIPEVSYREAIEYRGHFAQTVFECGPDVGVAAAVVYGAEGFDFTVGIHREHAIGRAVAVMDIDKERFEDGGAQGRHIAGENQIPVGGGGLEGGFDASDGSGAGKVVRDDGETEVGVFYRVSDKGNGTANRGCGGGRSQNQGRAV